MSIDVRYVECLEAKVKGLEAEHVRLMEALDKIAAWDVDSDSRDVDSVLFDVTAIAKRALGGGE
jgi:hypothetical protein